MCTIEENWNYEININAIEETSFSAFESQILKLSQHIMNLMNNGFIRKNNCDGIAKSSDYDLRYLMESNKNLRHEVDLKVKDCQQQQIRYKTFKNDQKLLSQEIKERHEAFLMAKKCYKKHLKIYYCIESKIDNKQTIYVQFFTEAKKESDNYSVRLIKQLESGKYELFSTKPKLNNFKEAQRKLQQLNDIPGTLCWVRDCFLRLKASNK